MDNAAYLLAAAGLMRGRVVAAHHESLPAYNSLFEGADVADRLFDARSAAGTSSGGMATLDLMLALIVRLEGPALADRVAHVLNYQRPEVDVSLVLEDAALARVDRRVARMVEIMQAHLEDPMTLETLCRVVGVDPSTARRLFHRPSAMARRPITAPGRWRGPGRSTTACSVADIATRAGFADPSAFSRAYRDMFGVLRSQHRRADPGA